MGPLFDLAEIVGTISALEWGAKCKVIAKEGKCDNYPEYKVNCAVSCSSSTQKKLEAEKKLEAAEKAQRVLIESGEAEVDGPALVAKGVAAAVAVRLVSPDALATNGTEIALPGGGGVMGPGVLAHLALHLLRHARRSSQGTQLLARLPDDHEPRVRDGRAPVQAHHAELVELFRNWRALLSHVEVEQLAALFAPLEGRQVYTQSSHRRAVDGVERVLVVARRF